MSLPQTGNELRGGNNITTRAEEEAFLEQVARETDATLTIEGYSVLGRPIWCISIGTGNTLLVTANVHGTEPSSREASLAWFRDIAYATDTATLNYLTAHRVVLIPNINIDGSEGVLKRENANGVNINRDYIALREPETRAVARVFMREQPTVNVDMHSVADNQGAAWRPWWEGTPGINPATLAISTALKEHVEAHLLTEGHTTLRYTQSQVSWNGLQSVAHAWHAVGLLSEVDAMIPRNEQAHLARMVLDACQAFHVSHGDELAQARADAVSYANTNTDPILLPASDYMRPTDPEIWVDGDAIITISGEVPTELFELHGIQWSGQEVSLRQSGKFFAAYLLGPGSFELIENKAAWNPRPEGKLAGDTLRGPVPLARIRRGTSLYPVELLVVRQGSSLYPAEQVMVRRGTSLYPT